MTTGKRDARMKGRKQREGKPPGKKGGKLSATKQGDPFFNHSLLPARQDFSSEKWVVVHHPYGNKKFD